VAPNLEGSVAAVRSVGGGTSSKFIGVPGGARGNSDADGPEWTKLLGEAALVSMALAGGTGAAAMGLTPGKVGGGGVIAAAPIVTSEDGGMGGGEATVVAAVGLTTVAAKVSEVVTAASSSCGGWVGGQVMPATAREAPGGNMAG